MFKKNYFLLAVIFITNVITSYSLMIYPLNYDKRIDNQNGGAYGEFIIKNPTNQPSRYKINAKSTGKETNISNLVTIYPKVLTVPAQSEEIIKVYVDDSKELKEGEYSFIMGIDPLKLPLFKEVKIGTTSTSISMKMGLDLEVFAYKGDLNKKFEILNEKFYEKNGKKYFSAEVKNSNKRAYELALGLRDSKEQLFPILQPIGRLFKDSISKVELEIPNNAKDIIFYDYNNNKILDQIIKIK